MAGEQILDALRFYADERSYCSGHNGPDVMLRDGGRRAKQALSALSDLQRDLRRLAGQLRDLHPCTCTRNKGLDTHPRECSAFGYAEEWLIAAELDQLAGSKEEDTPCR